MRLPDRLTRHKTFLTNVAAMMSGKSLAAAIALVTMPIIARLFSPSDFGVAAVFMSIVGIVSNVAALRYEMALVLPRHDSEAIVLLGLAYRVLLLVCAAMLVVIGLYEVLEFRWPALDLIGDWKWLLPLGVLFMSGLSIHEHWLARRASFKLVAVAQVLGSAVNSGARISFGALAGSSIFGLVFGNLLGMFSRLVIQELSGADKIAMIFRRIDWVEMRQVALRYSDFPKLNTPATFVFSLGQDLPVLLFGVMFSPTVAGFYAMANRLSQVPVVVVANSLRRVFLQKAAVVNNSGGSLRKAFVLTTAGLALLGVIPFGCLWLFGQPLLEWLLGNRWYEAGRYLETMAPWLLMLWVAAPSYPIFVVLRKQQIWLGLQVVLTILRLGAFGLAYLLSATPEWTLRAFVVTMMAGSVATIMTASFLISRHKNRIQI